MAMYKRYAGEFLSIDGTVWRSEIWQEAASAFASVGELDFPDDQPLVFEWPETGKSNVICGSAATITVISPSDRAYLDLYTVRPGTIRLDVYRDDSLYWSGTLDPEYAEEPYTSAEGYDVTLMFSDFGIWNRLKYNLAGRKTIYEVLEDALERSKINYTSIEQGLISSQIGSSSLTLDMLSVDSCNFLDEEDEPETLHDVIESMLRPLALRIVQKAGEIVIYDINGACDAPSSQIEWAVEDQTISVDKVYNKVSVTFSPYPRKNLTRGFEYTDHVDPDLTNITNDDPTATLGAEVYSYYPTYEPDKWNKDFYTNLSFSIFLSRQASGLAQIHSQAKYFKTVPILGGSEESGVAMWFYTGGHGSLESRFPVRKGMPASTPSSAIVMQTNRIFLAPMESSEAAKYYIRIRMKALVDVRYNPFVEAGKYNEPDNTKSMAGYNCLKVPLLVNLYGANGQSHYTNRSVIASPSELPQRISTSKGEWADGIAASGDCMLMFYKTEEGKVENDLFSGWIANRQAINLDTASPTAAMEAADDGQYIPYPENGGELEISVLAGVTRRTVGYNNESAITSVDYIRWALLGVPEIDIVRSNLTLTEVDTDDVVYEGTVNPDAAEELSLETMCGTMENPAPTARGLLSASSGPAFRELTRAGRTDCPEQLLIGTLLSQYASRKDVLSGTVMLGDGTFSVLTDAALPGKVLLPLAEVQDVRMCENEIRAAEIVPDDYTSEENG